MYKFSKKSIERLFQCDPRLQNLMGQAIVTAPFDFAIICGYRNEKDQNAAFKKGKTALVYPNSKHNKMPSLAIDIAPYPINWQDLTRFKILACHIKIVAYKLDIPIQWGGDWKLIKDYPHYELIKV